MKDSLYARNIQTFFVYKLYATNMKRYLFFLLFAFPAAPVFAQAPVDTTLSLQNIEIQGKRFGGLSGGEIKRLQVENNLTSLSGTTSEAFRQLPSLVTDIEGGITFRGSNKAGLLLNGIPYGLLEEYSGDMLIQLPALFFNRIALTSMPSVEWVPDGDAGVLNLASAELTAADSPLQLTLGAGLQERYNAGAVVNLHPGRFHIVAKYDYRREYRERSFRKITTNKAGTTEMNNNAAARPDVHLADLRVGYDLTGRDLLQVYGLYNRMDYDRYGMIRNSKQNPATGEWQPAMWRHRYNGQRQEAYAAEAAWRHRFAEPGEELNVVFNYNNFAYTEDNDYKNEKPGTGNIVAQDNLYIRQKKDNYYVSAGYRKTFEGGWAGKAGYTGRFRKETYRADAADLKQEEWVPNAGKSDDFSFYRRIHLLYASVEKQWDAFTAEAGVQGEYSRQHVCGDRHSRFYVYPRLRLGYRMENAGEWSLSYIERVIRPYGADLNPFVDTSDATRIRQGNPDLKNELIHTLELAYRFGTSRLSLFPGFYYRNKSDRIMEMAYEEDDRTVWKKANIGHSQTVGFELSANWTPMKLLSIGLAGNIYRDEIDGRTLGFDARKSLVAGDVKGNVNLHITRTTELQIDGFYVSDQLTPQGKIESHYSVNAGLSQYFLHRKLRANLSINNIFDSLEETTVVDTENLHIEQVRNRDARVTWLTLTYQL